MSSGRAGKILKVAAILFAVFIMNWGVANAVEINLITGSSSEKLTHNSGQFFKKQVRVEGGKLHLTVNQMHSYRINRILLYLCKTLGPSDCIKTQPIEYKNHVDTIFSLADIERNGVANLLTIVSVNKSWLAGWDSIRNGVVEDTELDSFDLGLKSDLDDARRILLKHGMVPLNFIDYADFGDKLLNQIKMNTLPSEFYWQDEEVNFSGLDLSPEIRDFKGYLFAFPKGQKVYNPLTFFNLDQECGDAVCNIGEDYRSCWLDCPCPEGQAPTRSGCAPKSEVTLAIDKIDPDPVLCVIEEGFCVVRGPLGNTIQVDLHLNNTPTNYTYHNQNFYTFENQTYPFITCMPMGYPETKFVKSSKMFEPAAAVTIFNVSKYFCFLSLPPLERAGEFTERKSLSIHMPISYDTKSGTETAEIVGLTPVTIKGYHIDANVDTLQEKRDRWEGRMEDVEKVLKVVQAIFGVLGAAAIVSLVCCTALGWVPGLGAGCCWVSSKIGFELSIIGVVMALLSLSISYCLKEYKGTGREIVKGWSRYCREQERAVKSMKQEVETSVEIGVKEVKSTFPNLVWTDGNVSGPHTSNVCNGENVKIWYNLEPLNCSEDLWFNFNSTERMECNCTTGSWIKPNLAWPENSCDCTSNTSLSVWRVENRTGDLVGVEKYNTTGIHLLFDGKASGLFAGESQLNLTLSCDSPAMGPVTDQFHILNYTSSC